MTLKRKRQEKSEIFDRNRRKFQFLASKVLNLAEVLKRKKHFDPMKDESIELNAEPVIGILAQTWDSLTRVEVILNDSSEK